MAKELSSNSQFFQWINNGLIQTAASGLRIVAEASRKSARDHKEFKKRSILHGLMDADEERLRDVGVTRSDLQKALELPLSVNAGRWLEQRRSERRLKARR